jgi:hypothetical protein
MMGKPDRSSNKNFRSLYIFLHSACSFSSWNPPGDPTNDKSPIGPRHRKRVTPNVNAADLHHQCTQSECPIGWNPDCRFLI